MAELGEKSCPPSYVYIKTPDECRRAANHLEPNSRTHVPVIVSDSGHIPVGCSRSRAMAHLANWLKWLYKFNSHGSSSMANPNSQVICRLGNDCLEFTHVVVQKNKLSAD